MASTTDDDEPVHTPFVLILHQVEDYPRWKAVFDAEAPRRKAAGELRFQVLAQDTDPNQVVHFSAWNDLEAARRFLESPELVEIRRRAGVQAPEFVYLNLCDQGAL